MTYFFGFIWLTIWLKPDSEDFYEEDMKYDNGALVCPEEKLPIQTNTTDVRNKVT